MTEAFLTAVNLSFSAGWLVLAVLIARLLLKKAPRWICVLLWGLVAVRLLCPFSLESTLSLIPSAEVVSPQIMTDPTPTVHTGIESVNLAVNRTLSENFTPTTGESANPLQILLPILSVGWIIGMAAMTEYSVFTYGRLRRQVRHAVRYRDNIYLCENIPSPFILGVFRPRIYLPNGITETDMFHVLAHERAHIRRKDHWWKPLGFALLTVHWFNPLLWLAYVLLCRDIELACDEKVVHQLRPSQRADYSQALLNCSVSQRSVAACPVAFGEVGVKERVKNVLTYRRPAFWVIVLALALCIVVAVCFVTSPVATEGLDWLQELDAAAIVSIEYRCSAADADRQYAKFEDPAILAAMADTLRRFDGEPAKDPEPSQPSDCIRLTVTMTDGTVRQITNHADRFLQIGEEYYEDTGSTLTLWNFSGTSPLPEATEPADSFYGVSLTVEEASPTGATVVFLGEGEKPEGRLLGGNDYWLQAKRDGIWEDITKVPEPSFTTESYDIDNNHRHKIDWQWRYGTLPSGHYRIGKDVTYQEGAKPLETATVWAEFTLSEPATDAYAILADLIPDGARAESTFSVGGGYNCFPDEAHALVQLLNGIGQAELTASADMIPILTLTVYTNETVILHYNGLYVQLAFPDSGISGNWAVDNDKLNEFMEWLLSMSPENSTYEIYNVAPLEDLSDHYSVEEAMIDKVVILMDGDVRYNEAVWWEFLEKTKAGEAATVRVMHYYSPGEGQSGCKRIMDLHFDGRTYELEHYEKGIHYVQPYSYLLYYAGNSVEGADYDRYEGYLLTNDPGGDSARYIENLASGYPPQIRDLIYTNLIYTPKTPELTFPVKAELRNAMIPLLTTTDSSQAQELWKLLSQAEYLGYEPKTYNLGPTLQFIGKNGSISSLRLCLDNDLFLYDGKFYDYGPGTNSNGGINNLPVFLGILGLSDWPEEVKNAYSDFFAETGSVIPPAANDLFPQNVGFVLNVWYPDWAYLELEDDQAKRLLKALEQEAPNPITGELPEVPDTVFTVHLAFDGGIEFDLAYMGQTEFYIRDFQTDQVYSLSSEALRQAVETAISETKAAQYS